VRCGSLVCRVQLKNLKRPAITLGTGAQITGEVLGRIGKEEGEPSLRASGRRWQSSKAEGLRTALQSLGQQKLEGWGSPPASCLPLLEPGLHPSNEGCGKG
jgi:hypothetical protein